MKKKSKSKLPKKILVKYTKKGNSEASKPSCYDYETILSSEELFSILNFRENQSSNIGMARPACVKRITATCVKNLINTDYAKLSSFINRIENRQREQRKRH